MEQVVVFGVFEADLQSGEIRKQGRRVNLQQQPFAVLKALVSRPNQLVSRSELRQLLWPSDVAVDFDQSLNKCITKVRDAIGDSATNPRFIETLPKRGYRFIAPVMVRVAVQAAPVMGLIVGDPLRGRGLRSWSLASIRD